MKKGQVHFSRDIRKEQIIREILFISESGKQATLMMIGQQLRTSPTNHLRQILNELGESGLVEIIDSVNSRNHPTIIYLPNHAAIKSHYGHEWYTNIMKGIKHRLE